MRLVEEGSRSAKAVVLLLALMVSFAGYVEQSFPSHDSVLRAIAIIAFTLIVVFACFALIGKIRYLGSFHILLAVLLLYGGLVAVLRGNVVAVVSPFLRLLLLLLVSLLTYNLLKYNRGSTQRAISAFIGWCSFFIIVQTAYEVLSGGGVFMNNAIRYYGSITSPIGFASLAFALLCALGYL